MNNNRGLLMLPFAIPATELFFIWYFTPAKMQPHLLLHPLDSTFPVFIVVAVMMLKVSRLGDLKSALCIPALSLHLLSALVVLGGRVATLSAALNSRGWGIALYLAYGILLLSGLMIFSIQPVTAQKRLGTRFYFLGAMVTLTFYPLVAQIFWMPLVTLAGGAVRGLLSLSQLRVESIGVCQGIILKSLSVTTSITSQSNGLLGMTFAVAMLSVLLAWDRPAVASWRVLTGYLLAAFAMWAINILRIAAILHSGAQFKPVILGVSGVLYALGFCAVYLVWLKPAFWRRNEAA